MHIAYGHSPEYGSDQGPARKKFTIQINRLGEL